MRRVLFSVVLTLVLALAAPVVGPSTSIAAAAEPKTSLAELEDEVMCPVCGTLLGLSQAPQADRQRVLIERLIDEGLTKEEIKQELVAEYGPQVLALPEGKGFNLAAYVLPIVGFLLAAILLFFAVRHWRRESEQDLKADAARDDVAGDEALDADEAQRLDRDIARYDL